MIRTAYLAGPIEYLVDGGIGWRKTIQKELKEIDVMALIPQDLNKEQELPPDKWEELREADPNRFRKEFRERILHPDMRVVASSSCVIVNWNPDIPTSGTHAEATQALLYKVPVFILTDKPDTIPMWLFACSTEIFASTSALISFLKGWNAAEKHKQ